MILDQWEVSSLGTECLSWQSLNCDTELFSVTTSCAGSDHKPQHALIPHSVRQNGRRVLPQPQLPELKPQIREIIKWNFFSKQPQPLPCTERRNRGDSQPARQARLAFLINNLNWVRRTRNVFFNNNIIHDLYLYTRVHSRSDIHNILLTPSLLKPLNVSCFGFIEL